MSKKSKTITRNTSTGGFVISALEDKKWDYRTAEGIAKQIHRNTVEVKNVLDTDPRIRRSVITTVSGKSLYSLKARRSLVGDIYKAFRALNSGKLDDE